MAMSASHALRLPARVVSEATGASPRTVERWRAGMGPRRTEYKNASHFCKAEREFVGEQAFRQQYGNHGSCVSGR